MKECKLNEDIIRQIIEKIVSTVKPEEIILFGSYVYGTLHKNSDIDLLVIKSGVKSKIEEYTKIRRSLRGIRFPFDIIVITPEEYEFYSLKWRNSILAEAREKGSVVLNSFTQLIEYNRTR